MTTFYELNTGGVAPGGQVGRENGASLPCEAGLRPAVQSNRKNLARFVARCMSAPRGPAGGVQWRAGLVPDTHAPARGVSAENSGIATPGADLLPRRANFTHPSTLQDASGRFRGCQYSGKRLGLCSVEFKRALNGSWRVVWTLNAGATWA